MDLMQHKKHFAAVDKKQQPIIHHRKADSGAVFYLWIMRLDVDGAGFCKSLFHFRSFAASANASRTHAGRLNPFAFA